MAVALTPGPSSAPSEDRPRAIVASVSAGDRIFRTGLRVAGLTVLIITGLILVFLILRSFTAFDAVGWRFFTTQSWFISTNQFGIAAILPDGDADRVDRADHRYPGGRGHGPVHLRVRAAAAAAHPHRG